MKTAVVLLSSGLDSTVNLYGAHKKFKVLKVLTFNYGQRAAEKEIEQSQKICAALGVSHQVIELPWLAQWTSTALVRREAIVPQGWSVQIDNKEQSLETAKAVWVPNRNGIFLNIAAALAESLKADYVIPGFNKEEATTFPDNTGDFLKALDHSFSFSTATQVKTHCFTTDLTKTEIVRLGREWNVPFELMWPCYFSGPKICGECESCQRFLRATKVSS